MGKISMMRRRRVLRAVEAQADDESLWFINGTIGEAYIQQALRNLHKVIEDNNQEALDAILEQAADHKG